MFYVGAHYSGGSFGAHCYFPAAAVGEGVHFFLHYVGGAAGGFNEEFLFFQGGDAQFLVAVQAEDFPGCGFYAREQVGLGRQQVAEAAQGVYHAAFPAIERSRAEFIMISSPRW